MTINFQIRRFANHLPWKRSWFLIVILALTFAASLPAQQPFTLDQILGARYLNERTASKTGHRLIWSENLRGHGDDDRNVIFSQTVDLVALLRARGVHIEQLIFPDEVHDFPLYSNWQRALQANSDCFDRQFSWPQK